MKIKLFILFTIITSFIFSENIKINVVNDLQLQKNNIIDQYQYYNTLSINSLYNNFSAGITLRLNNYYLQIPNNSNGDSNFDLYRKYIQFNSKNWHVNIGDFYTLLGKGLVLSVLKNDEIIKERTVLGAEIKYSKNSLNIKSIAGFVKNETDTQEWTVFGSEILYSPIKKIKIGAHFSFIDDNENNYNFYGKRYTTTFSLRLSNIFNIFDFYTEAGILDFDNDDIEDGYGIFSNLSYSKGHSTISVEFKRYKNFNNLMNNPPVADRGDELTNLIDTIGGRILYQYSFFDPDIVAFINLGYYEEGLDKGIHIYFGLEAQDIFDKLSIIGSYGVRNIIYPIKKADIDVLYQITDRISIESTYKLKYYKISDSIIFNEQDINFELSYLPNFSFFFLYQYSKQKIINRNHFYSGGFKYYISDSFNIRLLGGTMRGGETCSGGQCIKVQPFKGFKISIYKSF